MSASQTQQYLKELSVVTNVPASELVQVFRGEVLQLIKGRSDRQPRTWVHRDVANHLERWLSPNFVPKDLKHIPRVSSSQVVFGARLGLDLQGCTVTVAEARIEDAITINFRGVTQIGKPTEKQIALAAKFDCDIADLNRREADAVLDDLMTNINLETVEAESLAPGAAVVSIYDFFEEPFVISSIKPDGDIYFRGGQGKRTFARYVRRERD